MKLPVNGTMRRLTITTMILGIVATASTLIYGTVAWASDYHKQFVAANELEITVVDFQRQMTEKTEEFTREITKLKISNLQASIRRYEDELFALEFRIGEGTATALDRAAKARIERQLIELRREVAELRSADN